MRTNFYERNHVPIFCGRARFVDSHTVEVCEDKGAKQRLTASAIVIASGSRPYRPPDIDFGHPRVFDSDTILDLADTPQSITIYGAGVVGCEYTTMFRNLGIKVNLINTTLEAAGISRRRDHRCAVVPHARSGRAHSSRRTLRARRAP